MNYIRTFLNKSCVVVESKLFINDLADSFDLLRLVVTWRTTLPLLSLRDVLFVNPKFFAFMFYNIKFSSYFNFYLFISYGHYIVLELYNGHNKTFRQFIFKSNSFDSTIVFKHTSLFWVVVQLLMSVQVAIP